MSDLGIILSLPRFTVDFLSLPPFLFAVVALPPFLVGLLLGRWWAVPLAVGGVFLFFLLGLTVLWVQGADRVFPDVPLWFYATRMSMLVLGIPAGASTLGAVTHQVLQRLWRTIRERTGYRATVGDSVIRPFRILALLVLIPLAMWLAFAIRSDETRQLLDEIEEVRQLEAPPHLRIHSVTRRDLREVYLGTRSKDAQERTTRLYRLLGYLDEDQHYWDVTNAVADDTRAFYSREEKVVYLATEDEGGGVGELSPSEQKPLVRAIIRGLHDYHFDPDATFRALWWNLDARLAFAAVIDGDATVHADRYARQARTMETGGGRYLSAPADHLTDVPAPILRQWDFLDSAGADWVRDVLTSRGVGALNAYLAEPPPATTLILHPELVDTGWEPERLSSLDFRGSRVRLLPLGLHRTIHGSLGEFLLLNYLLRDAPFSPDWLRDPQNQAAVEAAAGWAGDYYYLYEGVEDSVLVARIRFMSEEDAHAFQEAHRAIATKEAEVVEGGIVTLATQENGNVTALVDPVGREVIFVIGTSAEVARAAIEPLADG